MRNHSFSILSVPEIIEILNAGGFIKVSGSPYSKVYRLSVEGGFEHVNEHVSTITRAIVLRTDNVHAAVVTLPGRETENILFKDWNAFVPYFGM